MVARRAVMAASQASSRNNDVRAATLPHSTRYGYANVGMLLTAGGGLPLTALAAERWGLGVAFALVGGVMMGAPLFLRRATVLKRKRQRQRQQRTDDAAGGDAEDRGFEEPT